MLVGFIALICCLICGCAVLAVAGARFGATAAFSTALMLVGVGYPTWRRPGSSYYSESLFWIGLLGMALAVVLVLLNWVVRACADYRQKRRYAPR